jgi:hypothetical protein
LLKSDGEKDIAESGIKLPEKIYLGKITNQIFPKILS